MDPNVAQPISNEPAVHDFNQPARLLSSFRFPPKVLAIFAVFFVLGLLTGFFLSRNKSINLSTQGGSVSSSNISKGQTFGSDDTKTFKDQAVGILKKGGTDGEGAYHLVRPGGDSQNVYLTSSLVDLSIFLDRKIKVWGQTQKAQRAGWLMDVGRVEVLE